ncbi:MAG TPA: type ISP restriction/modification enzyme, partial [Terriglobales bacterium]|nr:type ISP restriction/modification enzyme [Terriglobales bacterium]
RRKERDNVFGVGSRAPIAISLLVKNPNASEHGKIFFHDIGDYLNREEKLAKLDLLRNVDGVTEADGWEIIHPDEHGDWFGQREATFDSFIPLGDKRGMGTSCVFSSYSMGVKTNRDDWVYDFSKVTLWTRIDKMLDFFNSEVDRYSANGMGVPAEEFVLRDKTRIKWTSDVLGDLEKKRHHVFDESGLVSSLYRPFTKQWLYSSKTWNWSRHLMPKYFPSVGGSNKVISVTGLGSTKEFSALITDTLPDLEVVSKGQCFPEHLYAVDATAAIAASSEQRAASSENSIPFGSLKTTNLLNRVICLTLNGTKGFSVLMTDTLPDLHLIGDAQCFPMFLYETEEADQ